MECYKKDYPRPQLVRDNWTSLNGTWDFCFDDEARGERGSWYQMWPVNQAQTIEVPFTYETKRSGIGDERAHRQVWYRRSIEADAAQLSEAASFLPDLNKSPGHIPSKLSSRYRSSAHTSSQSCPSPSAVCRVAAVDQRNPPPSPRSHFLWPLQIL